MQTTIILALVMAGFVGPSAGYLGSIMIAKRMALVGDALSHVALPGLALGLLFNFNPFLGAFTLLVVVMIATWYLQKSTVLPVETIIGVLFVLALAVGLLITPETELLHALFGDISTITSLDTAITAVVAVVTILFTKLIYKDMTMTMISREMALSIGVKVERINLIYLILVATVVAIGIKEVGTILVGAVVIVPAAASRNISANLRGYVILSAVFGGASALAGVFVSYLTNIPAGPLVVIIGVFIFAVSFAMARLGLLVPLHSKG